MIKIDGAMGEGGGQVIRSSLSLSMLTGKPVHLENIRAGRDKPGLLRQHLTALRAAVEISGGTVEGDELRSTTVKFTPGTIRPGRYRFAVGTAGSAALVLQTILPALMLADAPSEIAVEGGTHNGKSPPFEFLAEAFLPLLGRMGPQVSLELVRPGFYPAGGGRMVARIEPVKALTPIELLEVGERGPMSTCAMVSSLPRNIGHREIVVIKDAFELSWPQTEVVQVEDPRGPGNVVLVKVPCGCLTEVFTGFGRRRKSAEDVANELVEEVRAYLATNAPVGEHLADQLLLPMALAGGGKFRTSPLSLHTTTNIEVIQRFLDVPFEVTNQEDGSVVVSVG
ncbi:MAG: RNA 3'-terminal phosphate cyclase (ATP) [Myxococcota bacterium]|jgi:RNA 3'-terminal phosphate cyclase (ATP)